MTVGVVVPQAPLQNVVRREVLPGPGGRGWVLVETLACGHGQWQRRQQEPTRPPRPRRCTACYLDMVLPKSIAEPPPPRCSSCGAWCRECPAGRTGLGER